jgi:cytochrome oxidase Cu insertion factor (SCO1/SenC/PrrC family)
MGSTSLTNTNSTIVSAFQSHLFHELLLVLGLLLVLAISWNALRALQLQRSLEARRTGSPVTDVRVREREASGRKVVRVGFGLLWILDGILQAQWAMPVGLATKAFQPAAAGSPSWVRHLVNAGALIWNDHPVEVAAAAVWIQVGIGVWLLVAPRGRWSQAGAVVSIGWGLVAWSFGEAFGQVFAPGLTILFGAPGAALFYCLAGGLIALPEEKWRHPRLGRHILGCMGAFFVGMAVLQAWPGRGFWQGAVHNRSSGTLVGMVEEMSRTPQPAYLSSWLSAFAGFDKAHGFAVNLVVVIVLAALGVGFCVARGRVLWAVVVVAGVFCAADWVLVEDMGVFGGLGTDPNTMVPIVLIVITGYVACTRLPVTVEVPEVVAVAPMGLLERATLRPSYTMRTMAAGGAALVTLLGVAPLAIASANPGADAIVTEAINGAPGLTDAPSPAFTLTDQFGHSVSLASLRGKVVALTFLDPVCTTDCPLIAQEFREADEQLGARAASTDFVAIVANPLYRSTVYTTTFDRVEGLDHLHNWLYLTGSVRALSTVWENYGVEVALSSGGAMVDHSDVAYVIDAQGKTRAVMSSDPGPGAASQTSFADLLASEVSHLLPGA